MLTCGSTIGKRKLYISIGSRRGIKASSCRTLVHNHIVLGYHILKSKLHLTIVLHENVPFLATQMCMSMYQCDAIDAMESYAKTRKLKRDLLRTKITHKF